MNKSTIKFCGGADTVTGANFLLNTAGKKILIDCGLLQGGERARLLNYNDFEYNPSDIDILFVTHAHADHIGRIPKLVKDGFDGIIYSTPATKDLAEVMFGDALALLTKEAREFNREPLYSADDVDKALSLWVTREYDEKTIIYDDLSVQFLDAGHILGSAMIKFKRKGKNIVFTGDLGNSPAPLLRDTRQVDDADYLVVESVYGNRNHENVEERTALLKRVILECYKRKGTLLIPSFAMQRTQILIYEINKLVENKEVPRIPVFLDSPLASRVTEVYRSYTHLFNERVQKEIREGDDIFSFPKFVIVQDAKESKTALNTPGPKIIISASGMSVGGKVLLYEKKVLSNKKNIILFVGYQGVGTLGRKIQDGAGKVKINNKDIRIKAARRTIRGFSAHKDMNNLIDFVSHTAEKNKKTFVVMGEPAASLFLVQRLRDFLEVDAVAPSRGQSVEIEF